MAHRQVCARAMREGERGWNRERCLAHALHNLKFTRAMDANAFCTIKIAQSSKPIVRCPTMSVRHAILRTKINLYVYAITVATCIGQQNARRAIIASSRRAEHFIQFNCGPWQIPFQISFNLKLMALLQRERSHVCRSRLSVYVSILFSAVVGCPLCCSNEQLKFHHSHLSHTHSTYGRRATNIFTPPFHSHLVGANCISLGWCNFAAISDAKMSGQAENSVYVCVCEDKFWKLHNNIGPANINMLR